MKTLKRPFVIALIGGLFYLSVQTFIHQMNVEFRTANSIYLWLWRAVMICFVSFGILHQKRLSKGYLSFKEGFRAGFSVTVFLVAFISLSTWIFCAYINPLQVENTERNYRDMQYNSMMKEYVYKTWKRDTISPGAIDTVQQSLDKYIKTTQFYFSNQGQIFIYFFYSLVYGLITTLTISMLNVRKKE
jgi:hypothetical protein